jgi:eukaryotic-like serine/threonine-protein kinase
MNAERWQSVKLLFESALAQPRDEREPYLRRECAGDGDLIRQVQSLLAAHDGAGSFLNSESPAASAIKLEPGTILGSYEIISLIGAGGMGEVYRARDARIGRDVAIKRLPRHLGLDRDRLRRFEREARLAGSLNHPNLVTIHDVGEHDGAPFVVMEFLRGETLRAELLRHRGALPARKAVDYAVQIASGLGAAHEQGIVHRDLKPENLFVMDDGRVKILDFGLAKAVQPAFTVPVAGQPDVDGSTTGGVVLGTAAYMSPEQVVGDPVDVRSDIFSLGLILHEMLSGQHPFKRGSSIETMHAILNEEAPQLFGIQPPVPFALDRVVRRCIEKKPAARFQSARDVGYALEAFQFPAGDGLQPAVRWRFAAWTGAVVAVIALSIAGLFFVRHQAGNVDYERLTFRRGMITQARFAPDGRTVVLGAMWDGGPMRIYVKRPENEDVLPLDLPPADLLSVSKTGELAILLDRRIQFAFTPSTGTLARAPMSGGAPRRLADNVIAADWAPDGNSIALVRDTGADQRLEIRSNDGDLLRLLLVTSSGTYDHLRFSPDGHRIAFIARPHRGSGLGSTVTVMNREGKESRSLGPAASFTDLTWSADGREVWFAEGDVVQTTIRGVTMSGRARTISRWPVHTSLSDIFGGKVLLVQSEVSARVSCLARGAHAERDLSWRIWNVPVALTADERAVVLLGRTRETMAIAVRPLDGSAVMELTKGVAHSLSADGRSVLIAPNPGKPQLAFVPLGPGERQSLAPMKLDGIAGATAAPNGKTVIVVGRMKNTLNLYEQTIIGGALRRISDEPLFFPYVAISPDSASVVALGPTYRLTVYGVADGRTTVIPTSIPGDYPIRFARDGSLLFMRIQSSTLTTIFRLDFQTQRETKIRDIGPDDRTGMLWANARAVSDDGQCYCYQYALVMSKLISAAGVDR